MVTKHVQMSSVSDRRKKIKYSRFFACFTTSTYICTVRVKAWKWASLSPSCGMLMLMPLPSFDLGLSRRGAHLRSPVVRTASPTRMMHYRRRRRHHHFPFPLPSPPPGLKRRLIVHPPSQACQHIHASLPPVSLPASISLGKGREEGGKMLAWGLLAP